MSVRNGLCGTAAALVVLGGALAAARGATAQSGYNAVWQGASTIQSSSFIDASAFSGTTYTDICQRILAALSYSSYPTGPRVVDARGLNSGNTSMTCANDTPWSNGTSSSSNPSVILLPPGTIVLGIPWVLPDQTTLVGVGRGRTTLVAGNGQSGQPAFTGAAMIEMCGGVNISSVCFAVGVRDLMLNGQGQSIDGIDNFHAEEQSYVASVSMTSIEGVGLNLGVATGGPSNGASGHSGPYTDLVFSAGGDGTCPDGPPAAGSGCPTRTTTCVRIANSQPRGIHGITCTANGYPNAAIQLDGQNVSLEDVHIEGFQNGILVGDTGATAANTIANVSGADGGSTSGGVGNLVHICNPASAVSPCTSGTWSVVDQSIQAVGAYTINGYTLEDDVTGTNLSDTTIALYVLGQPLGGGVSRLTTSPSTVSWGVGAGAPTGSCPTGALYSDTSTGSSHTIWVCQAGAWVGK